MDDRSRPWWPLGLAILLTVLVIVLADFRGAALVRDRTEAVDPRPVMHTGGLVVRPLRVGAL